MNRNSQRGGAVLITTVLILLIGGVLAIALLNSSRIGSRVSANYKLQENAFNIAEMGFERVRSTFVNFNNITSMLFFNPANTASLYDPNFNLYGEFGNGSGVYGTYYAINPQLRGTEVIQLPDGNTLTGEWFIRIIDNDLVCNEPLSGNFVTADGFLNIDHIKTVLSADYDTPEDEKRAMSGIMLSCRELDNTSAGGTGESCNTMPTIDFSTNQDRSIFVESLAIIRQGNDVIASRLVRFLVRTEATGGGGRNPTQKGGAAGGTRGTVSAGVTPVGWGN